MMRAESVSEAGRAGSGSDRALAGTDEPGPPDRTVNLADRTDEADEFELESQARAEPAAERKPAKRKRASVPSWDEIMFGGPKP